MGYQLTLTETLLAQLGQPGPQPINCDWEVGRLALAPEFRSDVNTLRHCLHIALEYASRNTRIHSLYATCTSVLGRLYRRFGFESFARDVRLGETEKVYTMIKGNVVTVSQALAGSSGIAAAAMN